MYKTVSGERHANLNFDGIKFENRELVTYNPSYDMNRSVFQITLTHFSLNEEESSFNESERKAGD